MVYTVLESGATTSAHPNALVLTTRVGMGRWAGRRSVYPGHPAVHGAPVVTARGTVLPAWVYSATVWLQEEGAVGVGVVPWSGGGGELQKHDHRDQHSMKKMRKINEKCHPCLPPPMPPPHAHVCTKGTTSSRDTAQHCVGCGWSQGEDVRS